MPPGPLFPIAILAGGLATRLRPITETIPKSLIDINGEPFIKHQLRHLKISGFHRVVICVGHFAEQIQRVIGNGSAFGLEIDYSFDGATLRGTAGALRHARHFLGPAFFVCYGDSFLPINFEPVQRAFLRSKKPALMTVLKNQGQWDKSNVRCVRGRILEYNKHEPSPDMEHIDYGLSLFESYALAGCDPDKPTDLADIFHQLSLKKQLAAYEVKKRFYEIGSIQGIEETRAFLASSRKA